MQQNALTKQLLHVILHSIIWCIFTTPL